MQEGDRQEGGRGIPGIGQSGPGSMSGRGQGHQRGGRGEEERSTRGKGGFEEGRV